MEPSADPLSRLLRVMPRMFSRAAYLVPSARKTASASRRFFHCVSYDSPSSFARSSSAQHSGLINSSGMPATNQAPIQAFSRK